MLCTPAEGNANSKFTDARKEEGKLSVKHAEVRQAEKELADAHALHQIKLRELADAQMLVEQKTRVIVELRVRNAPSCCCVNMYASLRRRVEFFLASLRRYDDLVSNMPDADACVDI